MTQLHKRFTDDQAKLLLKGYCQGLLERAEVQEMLVIDRLNHRGAPTDVTWTVDQDSSAWTVG